jgi:VWFA-related protein
LLWLPGRAAQAEHIVTVTAVVHDAEGRAISALSGNDFVLTQRGQPQSPSRFRNLRPAQELISQRPPDQYLISNRPLAALESRQPVSVLVLDTRNTDPEFQPWMRNQVLRFVSMLRTGEDVAFYQLSASGIKLLHEFSSHKPQLTDTLQPVSEPETAQQLEREAASKSLSAERYSATCEAIASVAAYLGQFDTRKNLFWMAGDFPPVALSAKKRAQFSSPRCIEMERALNLSNTAVYPVDVRSPIAPEPFLKFAPGNLFAIPRGRREALSSEWQNTMAALSALTGGRPISNRSQLAEALVDTLRETRFAYELGFDLKDSECDGKFHPLRVETKVHDVNVLAKQAFVADCSESPQRASSVPFDSPTIGISVAPRVHGAGASTVDLQILINAADLQWVGNGETARASTQITVEETTVSGESRLLTSRTVPLRTSAGQHGFDQIKISFEPDKTAQSFHLTIRDETNGRQGSVTFTNTH